VSLRDVPINEWPQFLQDFSLGHRAWLATVDRLSPRAAHHIDVVERPLRSITPEVRANRVVSIEIRFQEDSHAREAVRIDAPTSVRVELNLGQLVRQAHGSKAFLVGFTTHTGTVTAASNWDEPAQRKRVRPSMAGSYERLFHDAGVERFLLLLREGPAREALREDRLERAIGVIYRPESERLSHYFRARLPEQLDAVLHIDQTAALGPLERWAHDEVDVPETYPTGI
jgi:hypothetical protein